MPNPGLDVLPGRLVRTAPLLKQSQVEDMAMEKERISATINAPPYIRNQVQDRTQLVKTLRKLEASLERDSPKPVKGQDLDKLVKREAELREAMVADMCTQAEMRRNPPGAVDKLLAFEKKHKKNHGEWQNIRRLLHVSGALPDSVSERSLSNLEMYRPAGGAGELPMDGAQIPQARSFHGLGGRSSTLTDREMQLIQLLAPELYEKLALLTADQRDELKDALTNQAPDFDNMEMKELRDRCRAIDEETGGTKQELIARLKAHHEAQARAA